MLPTPQGLHRVLHIPRSMFVALWYDTTNDRVLYRDVNGTGEAATGAFLSFWEHPGTQAALHSPGHVNRISGAPGEEGHCLLVCGLTQLTLIVDSATTGELLHNQPDLTLRPWPTTGPNEVLGWDGLDRDRIRVTGPAGELRDALEAFEDLSADLTRLEQALLGS